MRRRPAPGLRVALALALLAGCGGDPGSEPPAIAYGLDECARCRMIVGEPAFAAARVAPDGSVERFDDIGCLLAALAAAPGTSGQVAADRIWVHDRDTGEPLAAAAAWFVRLDAAATPMGSGWVAYADRERAIESAARQPAGVARWDQIAGAAAVADRDGR